MVYKNSNQIINTEELIGAFSGYVRRPHPTVAGMIAQFFGEDGEDADTISALSLTKYQDAQVYIQVYLIKDALGKVIKKDNNYVNIANFLGVVRRPKPVRGGMVAEFFAPNGEDADSVNNLGKSIYQDCFVYVEVKGKLAKSKPIENNINTIIDNNYIDKVSEKEKKEYLKKEKTFKKINEILLLSGFLQNSEVLFNLGKEIEYIEWLKNKNCIHYHHSKECRASPCETLQIKGMQAFNYIPLCNDHLEKIKEAIDKNNIDHIIQGGMTYLNTRNIILVQEWAWEKMKNNFSLTGKEEPQPEKIITWASKNNLYNKLPEKYRKIAL